jgi:hypothetical protein
MIQCGAVLLPRQQFVDQIAALAEGGFKASTNELYETNEISEIRHFSRGERPRYAWLIELRSRRNCRDTERSTRSSNSGLHS